MYFWGWLTAVSGYLMLGTNGAIFPSVYEPSLFPRIRGKSLFLECLLMDA